MFAPNVRKTWVPVGQTPILRHSYRHDRVSVISAITTSAVGQGSLNNAELGIIK